MKFVDVKKEHELVTPTDKWTYFIKNAKNLTVIPSFVDEEGLLTAFNEADKHNWKREELIAYDNASMRIQDARGERELAEEQGIEKGIVQGIEKGIVQGIVQGIEKGIVQGIEKGKEEVVPEMHKKGFSIEVISEVTKLPIDKVQQIVEEYERNKK